MKTKLLLLSLIVAIHGYAGSRTWNLDPINDNWNDSLNWTPNTVPNGPADVATFSLSNTTAVSISAGTEVNAITFGPGASAFTITVPTTLTVSGAGIINNSGIRQSFSTDGGIFDVATIQFWAEAGS